MKAFYDNQPSKLEPVGNGSYHYRYNINEVDKPSQGEDVEQTQTQWECEEVTVWAPLSANKITEKVLTERWDGNYEQKLVNEYNSAQLGMMSEEEATTRINTYKEFLAARSALKALVDADCKELGIR